MSDPTSSEGVEKTAVFFEPTNINRTGRPDQLKRRLEEASLKTYAAALTDEVQEKVRSAGTFAPLGPFTVRNRVEVNKGYTNLREFSDIAKELKNETEKLEQIIEEINEKNASPVTTVEDKVILSEALNLAKDRIAVLRDKLDTLSEVTTSKGRVDKVEGFREILTEHSQTKGTEFIHTLPGSKPLSDEKKFPVIGQIFKVGGEVLKKKAAPVPPQAPVIPAPVQAPASIVPTQTPAAISPTPVSAPIKNSNTPLVPPSAAREDKPRPSYLPLKELFAVISRNTEFNIKSFLAWKRRWFDSGELDKFRERNGNIQISNEVIQNAKRAITIYTEALQTEGISRELYDSALSNITLSIRMLTGVHDPKSNDIEYAAKNNILNGSLDTVEAKIKKIKQGEESVTTAQPKMAAQEQSLPSVEDIYRTWDVGEMENEERQNFAIKTFEEYKDFMLEVGRAKKIGMFISLIEDKKKIEETLKPDRQFAWTLIQLFNHTLAEKKEEWKKYLEAEKGVETLEQSSKNPILRPGLTLRNIFSTRLRTATPETPQPAAASPEAQEPNQEKENHSRKAMKDVGELFSAREKYITPQGTPTWRVYAAATVLAVAGVAAYRTQAPSAPTSSKPNPIASVPASSKPTSEQTLSRENLSEDPRFTWMKYFNGGKEDPQLAKDLSRLAMYPTSAINKREEFMKNHAKLYFKNGSASAALGLMGNIIQEGAGVNAKKDDKDPYSHMPENVRLELIKLWKNLNDASMATSAEKLKASTYDEALIELAGKISRKQNS